MNKTKLKVGLVGSLMAVCGMANAGYVEEDTANVNRGADKATAVKVSSKLNKSEDLFGDADANKIVQLGVAPEKLTFIKGYANNVTLITALKQIVPSGWHAKKSGDIDTGLNVSWKGGKNWVAILQDLANQGSFNAKIDWDNKVVTVMTADSDSNTKQVVKQHVKVWELKGGKTVRDSIESWAAADGYTVSWAAVDYDVPASVSFVGNLDDENGPLARVTEAYKNSDQPIVISVSTLDKVIRVENLEKKQKVVRD